jgi:N-acyl-D-amino-acid deacylase
MFETLLKNAKIVDGTGNPWYFGDIGISGEKIAAIGKFDSDQAQKTYQINGLTLAPGFIDGHSHSDLFVLSNPLSNQKVLQGCTTENVGLDGMSVAPISDTNKFEWQKHLSGLAGISKFEWSWNSMSEYFDAIDRVKPSVNISSYVGLGTIRLQVLGMQDSPADPKEVEAMQEIAEQAMLDGARGISAGLIYPPSSYQSMNEMVSIAKTVARYDGIYDVHMRNEADFIDQSMDEVIEIGRQSGISILITHFKVRGKNNWGRSDSLLQKLDQARKDNIDVTIAQYPYTAGSTFLQVVIPPWFHTGGATNLLELLKSKRDEIKADIKNRRDWENFAYSVGWEKIYISSVASEKNQIFEGKSVSEIAEIMKVVDPVDAVCDLLIEEELAVGMISFGLEENDVQKIMAHSSVSFITDGLLSGKKPHPRALATFPRILGRYVRDQNVMSLEDAIRKMTSLPAQKLRIKNKGLIREGFDADITVFNENTILDTNSYETPLIHPEGIEHVLVNGSFVVEHGVHTGRTPGKTIRK